MTERTRESVEQDIIAHPEKHMHRTDGELLECCMVGGGVDLHLVDVHDRHVDLGFGSNNNARCTTSDGPCPCGAWHNGENDPKNRLPGETFDNQRNRMLFPERYAEGFFDEPIGPKKKQNGKIIPSWMRVIK